MKIQDKKLVSECGCLYSTPAPDNMHELPTWWEYWEVEIGDHEYDCPTLGKKRVQLIIPTLHCFARSVENVLPDTCFAPIVTVGDLEAKIVIPDLFLCSTFSMPWDTQAFSNRLVHNTLKALAIFARAMRRNGIDDSAIIEFITEKIDFFRL